MPPALRERWYVVCKLNSHHKYRHGNVSYSLPRFNLNCTNTENQGDHLHALRGHPGRRAEARTSGPRGQRNARHHDHHEGCLLQQVPECSAASHRQISKSWNHGTDWHTINDDLLAIGWPLTLPSSGATHHPLLPGRPWDVSDCLPDHWAATDCGLPAGHPQCYPPAAHVLPPGCLTRIWCKLSSLSYHCKLSLLSRMWEKRRSCCKLPRATIAS